MVDFEQKEHYKIEDLLDIMKILRGENGCPWDQVQTHQSIRKNMIEETYEVVEAIDKEDPILLQEELGDILMQVVFHSQIEESEGRFTFDDVCDGVCKKLIVRHPHVFGNLSVADSDEVLTNWDSIKRKTKGQTSFTETLQSVPAVLPALMKSEKIQSRAAKAGFEYPNIAGAMYDLVSEVEELKQAITDGNQENIDEELGDVLFSCVNVSRFAKIDSEHSLTKSCNKFISRFAKVEHLCREQGMEMTEASLEQLDELWKKAKTIQ